MISPYIFFYARGLNLTLTAFLKSMNLQYIMWLEIPFTRGRHSLLRPQGAQICCVRCVNPNTNWRPLAFPLSSPLTSPHFAPHVPALRRGPLFTGLKPVSVGTWHLEQRRTRSWLGERAKFHFKLEIMPFSCTVRIVEPTSTRDGNRFLYAEHRWITVTPSRIILAGWAFSVVGRTETIRKKILLLSQSH